jgi:hypothetical protein
MSTTLIRVLIPANDAIIVSVYDVALRGPTGPSGSSNSTTKFIAPQDGAQTLTYPSLPALAGIEAVYINGLRQAPATGSLSGSTVTLDALLEIITGDEIQIDVKFL